MEECYDFFEDLCTVNELQAISQRIVVAKMLSEKRVYSDIVRETGASTATISRVNRSCSSAATVMKNYLPAWPKRDKAKNELRRFSEFYDALTANVSYDTVSQVLSSLLT